MQKFKVRNIKIHHNFNNNSNDKCIIIFKKDIRKNLIKRKNQKLIRITIKKAKIKVKILIKASFQLSQVFS
jgi:hypothetical protein